MKNASSTSAAHASVPRYYNSSLERRGGLTRERIRQIETIAMRKFRRELVKRGIEQSDLLLDAR